MSTRKKYYLFYNIPHIKIKKINFPTFRVDVELYQHGSKPISVQNLQMLCYKIISCIDA